MKTRNLIFAILWVLAAIAMIIVSVASFGMAEYWLTVFAAMVCCVDSYNAWVHLGHWLEARKALKNTEK